LQVSGRSREATLEPDDLASDDLASDDLAPAAETPLDPSVAGDDCVGDDWVAVVLPVEVSVVLPDSGDDFFPEHPASIAATSTAHQHALSIRFKLGLLDEDIGLRGGGMFVEGVSEVSRDVRVVREPREPRLAKRLGGTVAAPNRVPQAFDRVGPLATKVVNVGVAHHH
jgi:hypothetical protein